MENKDILPFLNKIVCFTYQDKLDGEMFRKGELISISDSAITIRHNGKLQAYNIDKILRLREAEE